MPEKFYTEAVEWCPYCEQENSFPNWDVTKQGYVATCQHCGKKILLCDECLHADDNPAQLCDSNELCYRKVDYYLNQEDCSREFKAKLIVDYINTSMRDCNGFLYRVYKYWCKLYDLFPLEDDFSNDEWITNLRKLHGWLSMIPDNYVYAIADYGREKHYRKNNLI